MFLAISRKRKACRHSQELHDEFSRRLLCQDDGRLVMAAEISQRALIRHKVHKVPRKWACLSKEIQQRWILKIKKTLPFSYGAPSFPEICLQSRGWQLRWPVTSMEQVRCQRSIYSSQSTCKSYNQSLGKNTWRSVSIQSPIFQRNSWI